MPTAILDPFSGISGDMTLGALVDLGLPAAFLEALPARLGLNGIGVSVRRVTRNDLASVKVDFDIPEQGHGRHISEIREIVEAAGLSSEVNARAQAVFSAIATAEGEMHGVDPAEVHLHEVGAVDAILDVVGSVWGMSELGIGAVFCSTISLGDGFVKAAHGVLPVPAPATLRLLHGHRVRPGPEGSGELVTPTGAAIVRVMSQGPPPSDFVPIGAGYGAGTKELIGRSNVLRILLVKDAANGASHREQLAMLAADIDDMSPELLAAVQDVLLEAGALDVVMTATHMKKGRVGTRVEALVRPADVDAVEGLLFVHSSTLGVRRSDVQRRVLARAEGTVTVFGHVVRVKTATLPNGSRRRKAEYDDVRAAARATGRSAAEIAAAALAEAERA